MKKSLQFDYREGKQEGFDVINESLRWWIPEIYKFRKPGMQVCGHSAIRGYHDTGQKRDLKRISGI